MTEVLALPTRSLAAFCIMWFTCSRQSEQSQEGSGRRCGGRDGDVERGRGRDGEREGEREGARERGREGERERGSETINTDYDPLTSEQQGHQ